MSAAPLVTLLFVYGSLRPGSANPHAVFLTARCRSLGNARMKGRLFRLGTGFAAVHEPESKSEIAGEILQLPAAAAPILESLDRYEGLGCGLPEPPAFVRSTVSVLLESGGTLECWTWLYCRPVEGLTLVPHGDALAKPARTGRTAPLA